MGGIRTALFPTRFDVLSLASVRKLYPLRRAGLEEIVLLFVVDRDEVAFIPFGGFDRKLADQLTEEARLRFADWEREIVDRGLRCRSVVEIGRPAGKILEVADRERVDLIVTGRQRHLPLDAVFLGGTAMELLRRSGVPVLVDKPAAAGAPEESADLFGTILYATDFSERFRPAAELLKALKGAAGPVSVVHVLSERNFARHSGEEIRVEERADAAELREVCEELEAAGLRAEPHERAGEVAAEILGAAEDGSASLVVMGTSEREAVKEFFLGSVSHRVAELSPVPVLLVPARRDEG